MNGVNAYQCSKLMNIGEDKAYYYYRLLKKGLTVIQIFDNYKENKSKYGRKKKIFSQEKSTIINELFDKVWSIDAICERDKLVESDERCSTKTSYGMVKDGLFDESKLKRKGYNQKETKGKINDCKTIHERNEKYPDPKPSIKFRYFEGNTTVKEKRTSVIVTLVEKQSKYIVLLKASKKSENVLESIKTWLATVPENEIKTIVFDRGKEFAR